MGAARQPDTEDLLRRARSGDESAVEQLLERHRSRLRQMVAVRLDPQLAARVDPSDVVQEAITDAALQLPDFLHDRPLPFCLLDLPGKPTQRQTQQHYEQQERPQTELIPAAFRFRRAGIVHGDALRRWKAIRQSV